MLTGALVDTVLHANGMAVTLWGARAGSSR
ncbi:hypothetical protein RS86_03175 [Microbacterium azadirachtae]|uniref:Uncharacterized protein n=1 Tax=Microbacterium azadirachtae TaxID=582680 RepID=A0A0F0LGV2_9MICO|nr:hypothetical protein RS86_03175 [Microbacterium azadirachtae]